MNDQERIVNLNPDFYTKFESMRAGDFCAWVHNNNMDESKLVFHDSGSTEMYAHYDDANDELILSSDPYEDQYEGGIFPLEFVGSAGQQKVKGDEEDGEAE